MSGARTANRLPRTGYRLARHNPGQKHLKGADVTPKMQRQYEHILGSLRRYSRYRTDRKRKQVAAATVRKLAYGNPLNDAEQRAEELAAAFHGRPVDQIIEVDETEQYSTWGSVLGELQSLDILMEDGRSFQTIRFDFNMGDANNVLVVAPDKNNIEFIGGDQCVPWQEIEGAGHTDKNIVLVGPVCEIDYWADKFHLGGSDIDKKGVTYFHEFGDEGGDLPWLAYDTRNEKLILEGGDYTIEPEGITG